MLFFLIYLAVRRMLRVLAGASAQRSLEIENAVLRHQLAVLCRRVRRPRLRRGDRVLLAAASRLLPKERWASFLVTPQTLLRWHRELVRRKWTYRRHRPIGRPAVEAELRVVVTRLGLENPGWGACASRASSPVSASAWERPRSGRSFAEQGMVLCDGVTARPGPSS